MSFNESDEDGEWEVVDIVHTTTSVNPNKKPKVAKQEDVDKLADEIRSKLSMKSTHDTQQMLILEEKLRRQQRLSEQQLADIESKLRQLTEVQQSQQRQQKDLDQQRQRLEAQQKRALLEQQCKIQSLSEHQLLTQKQIAEAQAKIEHTQMATQSVSENVLSLQQRQQRQAQQIEIAKMRMAAQQQQPPPFAMPPLPPPNALYNAPSAAAPSASGGNVGGNMAGSSNGSGWLPSFLVFGSKSDAHSQGMDIASSPPITSAIATAMEHSALSAAHAAEEKANVLDDDDDVLRWTSDSGAPPPETEVFALRTKDVIGAGSFKPSERRQCGWILQNDSESAMALRARLECIGGAEGIKIKTDGKGYDLSLGPGEEAFIVIEVEAPAIAGKFCAFCQLVADSGAKVGETLEVQCDVEPQFGEEQELKIASLVAMGFDDRPKVVRLLKKKKWNVPQTVNALVAL